MPYENYLTEEDFERHHLSGRVTRYLNEHYAPNPWIFVIGGKPLPFEERYFFEFRNFDNSRHLFLSVDVTDGEPRFRRSEK